MNWENLFPNLSFTDGHILTLFRVGLFGAAHGWGYQKGIPPKMRHTCLTMMKLKTVIPFLKKIFKIYKSRETPFEFC